jgi:hypothetical protein
MVGQADEAEHQGRAHGAFEPVERVVPEGRGDLRQAGVGERREGAGPRRQDPQGGQIRLLDDLRIDLGADARIGQRDGEDAGGRRQAEHLRQQQRPEQLVDRAQAGAGEPHAPDLRERDGEDEAGPGPERDAEDREGDGVDDAPDLHRREIRVDQAGEQALQVGPGMEAGDGEIGQEKRRRRAADEPARCGGIAAARRQAEDVHAACP